MNDKPLGPCGTPHSRDSARMLSREIRARAATALSAYEQRSAELQLIARDPDGPLDRLADELGVDRDEMREAQQPEKLILAGALTELMADLAHVCAAAGIPWRQVAADGYDAYAKQSVAMQRFLIYENPDLPDQGDYTTRLVGL